MILFIDTHDELITIALKNKKDLFIKTQMSEYSHSVFTMPMIESIFKENNLNVKDLKKIIVVNGPGSFTGIRIGLSIAKTMAYALKIDINTISSLLAYLVSNDNNKKRRVVIEDNKGYYICAMDENNNIIVNEYYCEESIFRFFVSRWEQTTRPVSVPAFSQGFLLPLSSHSVRTDCSTVKRVRISRIA